MDGLRRVLISGVCASLLTLGTSLLPTNAQNHPDPVPVTLDPSATAVFVLDLNARCNDPDQVCSQLIPGLSQFLPRARAAGAFVLYTVSSSAVGTPLEPVADGIQPGPDDVVLHPGGFNKFVDPQLKPILDQHGIDTIVMTGSSSNVAILYTATAAARDYGYNVVIAEDGINAATPYEAAYPLHQFTVLPGGVQPLFSYSNLDMIAF